MKSFLEEYGFAILAAIVIILLIAMASPLGDIIRTQLSNIVNKFANSANKKLDAAENSDYSAVLANGKLTIFAPSKTDAFEVKLHWVAGGDTKTSAAYTALSPDSDSYTTEITNVLAAGAIESSAVTPDKGSEYYVEIKNTGTGDVFFSNRVKKA